MRTEIAIARNMAAMARGSRARVFDWDEAARVIKESGCSEANAGLSGDLEWTGGIILEGGAPVPKDHTYTFLQSNWATPVLIIDDEERECWKFSDETEFNAYTYWPQSALDILSGDN